MSVACVSPVFARPSGGVTSRSAALCQNTRHVVPAEIVQGIFRSRKTQLACPAWKQGAGNHSSAETAWSSERSHRTHKPTTPQESSQFSGRLQSLTLPSSRPTASTEAAMVRGGVGYGVIVHPVEQRAKPARAITLRQRCFRARRRRAVFARCLMRGLADLTTHRPPPTSRR